MQVLSVIVEPAIVTVRALVYTPPPLLLLAVVRLLLTVAFVIAKVVVLLVVKVLSIEKENNVFHVILH